MLDILLSRLKEEIAIDGSTGSNIETVWEYVESISKVIAKESGASITPLVDLKYKAFIWNYLKHEKDLEFYENIATEETESNITATITEVANSNINVPETGTEVSVDTNDAIPEAGIEPPASTNKAMFEADTEVLDYMNTANTSSRKRKAPPKSKKKTKPKKKVKSKPKKLVAAGASDDDFEADNNSDSSSESDFEDDILEPDNSEDSDSEDFLTDEDTPAPEKKTSANKKSKKKSIKPILNQVEDIVDLNYDQMVEKYGNRLHITGSLELQEQQLYIGVPPGGNMSTNLVVILQAILKTRSKGLLQADITKDLDIDSRSTGHYCKSLEEKGAITRKGVSTRKMRTNICIHARFATNKETVIDIKEEDHVPYNVNSKGIAFSQTTLRDSLIDLAKDAPNQLIMSDDVLRALGFDTAKTSVRKWFNRTLNELCGKGYVRKSHVKNVGSTKPRRCIKLVRIPENSTAANEVHTMDIQYPIRIKNPGKNITIIPFLVDASIESQTLQVLLAAGENGATQREIGFALNTDETRVLYRYLEKMCELRDIGLERFGAMRVLEFEGRQRRYRYFTYASFYKNENNADFVPRPIPEPDMDESNNCEMDPFVEFPHTLKLHLKLMLEHKKGKKISEIRYNEDGIEAVKKTGRPKKAKFDENGQPVKKSPYVRKNKKNPTATSSSATTSTPNPPTSSISINTAAVSTPSNVNVVAANTGIPVAVASSVTQVVRHDLEVPVPILNNQIVAINNAVVNNETSKSSQATDNLESSVSHPAVEQSSTISSISTDAEVTELTEASKVRRRDSVSAEVPTKKARIAEEDITTITQTTPTVDLTNDVETSAIRNPSPRVEANNPPATVTAPIKKVQKRTIADYFTKKPQEQPKKSISSTPPIASMDGVEQTPLSNNKTVEPMEIETAEAVKIGDSNETPICVSITENVATTNSSTQTMTSQEVSVGKPAVETTLSKPAADNVIVVESVAATEPTSNNFEPRSSVEGSNSEDTINDPSSKRLTAEISTTDTVPKAVISTPEAPNIRGPREMVATLKKGYSHKVPQVNVYLEIRMKVLLKMLEDKPMWDISKELNDSYRKKATELFGEPKYSVCTRTLWRSATTLASRGEAIIDTIQCSLLNGQTVKKRILVHKDVDINGKEYKCFKKNLRDKRVFQQPHTSSGRMEIIDTPVETLEGRIVRMKTRLQTLVEKNKASESKALQLRISEYSENAEKFSPFYYDHSVSSWLITGIQFGWTRAKMLRIKMLHSHIFGLWSGEETIEGVDKENNLISMSAVVNKMPLGLYCSMIGVFEPDPKITEYVREHMNAGVTYEDMPHHVRSVLYSDKHKFRRRLHKLFFGLEFLNLITSVSPTADGYTEAAKYGKLTPLFRLERSVAIRDVKRLGQPIVREHVLDTEADVALYWSELQYVSLQVEVNASKEEHEPLPDHSAELELFRGISNPTNWSNASVYTRRQRKILNSYVDKTQGTTPLKNYSVCADIADEIGATVTYVRRYFAKVEVAFERKEKDRERRKNERRINPIAIKWTKRRKNKDFDSRRVINLSSTTAFHRFSSENVKPREGNLYMDDIGNLPVVTNNTLGKHTPRKKRMPWSTDDDELLIYSYVILRHRAARSSFRWPAILQVFPLRKTEACRNRLDRMLTDILYMEQLETASNFWNRFYNEGIQRGEIEDPNPREMVNFDLLSFLTYFLKRLNDGEPLFDQILLPSDVTEIGRHFNVVHGVANTNPYYFEDRYYTAGTLVTQMATLYHQSLSVRRVGNHEYDIDQSSLHEEDNIDQRSIGLLKSYAMMNLLSPAETYDPFFSYSIFLSYPKELFNIALEHMRSEGILIHAKLDRSVPGSRYGLASKVYQIMSGKLPQNLLEQTREYYKYLNEQTSSNRFVPEVVSSGMMACLMTLLSEYKLNITIANRSKKLKQLENLNFTGRSIDRSLLNLDMDLQKANNEELQVRENTINEPDFKITTEQEFDIQLGVFLKTQPDDTKKSIRLIADTLKLHESNGLSLYQLKASVKDHIGDDAILHVIDLLEKTEPPMICCVGFNASRYVLSPYLESWVIDTRNILTHASSPKSNSDETTISEKINVEFRRKNIIKPRLWNDLNGNITQVILKECKEALVDYLVRRPGSTEANIHRQFSSLLSRADLHDLLQVLVKDSTLRQTLIIQPNEEKARKSIFTNICSSKCTTKPIIEKATQTCYWVSTLSL